MGSAGGWAVRPVVGSSAGAAARWDAEPWLALRARRGAGAAEGSLAWEVWPAEPSAAVRDRRGAAAVRPTGHGFRAPEDVDPVAMLEENLGVGWEF
ncbi:hypothetical protein AB0B09_40375, partial [Streptomyces sp. NPDC044948]